MFSAAQTMPPAYPRSGIYPPSLEQSESSGGDDDTTLAGLKEIVSKQQKEIESHQQQLVAKEQRLKFLKQPETQHLDEDTIRAMREKVQAQEQKLERLRELRGQVDQQRLLNVSELDSVKALFKDKERELMEAVSKVEMLSKQLDSMKKTQIVRGSGDKVSIASEEVSRLKEELRATQESNEQKNRELVVQLDLLNQRNKQVDYLDKRIEELQSRLRKKKEAERNPVVLGPVKNVSTNIATVEPSIRIEPVNVHNNDDVRKIPLVPNPHDPRYQTLPNSFKYTPNCNPASIYSSKDPEKAGIKPLPHSLDYQQPIRNSPETVPNHHAEPESEHLTAAKSGPVKYTPIPYRSESKDQPRPMYTSTSQLPNRPQISSIVGDTNNNNNRHNSLDYAKKDHTGSSLRPNTSSAPVTAMNKPMYASRSVIADTYMKRLGPKPVPDPHYKAMAPHSIPAFHLKNSIISDKVSSKNNTLRSLRRRHSYTETDEAKIEAALGPREITPGSSTTTEPRVQNESPKPKEPQPEKAAHNTSNTSSTSSDEPKVPNSGIVARQILKKELGVKRNLDRRVTFDPHALLLDASLEGEFELVQRSAAQVPDPSQPNDEGITALHNAICAGHFDIVKFLVKYGVDVNSQDIDGWTPLHCASSCNNLPMVKFLVENGACIYAQTLSDHETPAEKCEDEDDDGCSQYLYGIQEKLGVLNGGTVFALYDYQARKPDELSFRNGDKLTLLRHTDKDEKEWWWARLGNKEGYVPRTFLGLFPRVKC